MLNDRGSSEVPVPKGTPFWQRAGLSLRPVPEQPTARNSRLRSKNHHCQPWVGSDGS